MDFDAFLSRRTRPKPKRRSKSHGNLEKKKVQKRLEFDSSDDSSSLEDNGQIHKTMTNNENSGSGAEEDGWSFSFASSSFEDENDDDDEDPYEEIMQPIRKRASRLGKGYDAFHSQKYDRMLHVFEGNVKQTENALMDAWKALPQRQRDRYTRPMIKTWW